jgi:hypothetical protein
MRAEIIPKYSLIISMPERVIQHELNVIRNEAMLREVSESVENLINIESFLQSFTKKSLPKKAVKKPVKLVFQVENQTENPHEKPSEKPLETLVVPTVSKTKKQKTTVVVTKPKQRTKRQIKFDVEE